MKLKKIATAVLAGLMAVTCILPLASCNKTSGSDGDVAAEGEVKVKILKMGKALATVIRTESSTIVIDTGDADHAQDVVAFLSEKEVSTVDAVILTNYSKKCIGGMPDLLASGITVKAVYGSTYKKDSNAYDLFNNAIQSYNLTVETISEQKELAFGDLKLNFYPAAKDYSTSEDENDEENSMAVVASFGESDLLFTSRIAGERLAELTTQLSGKTFEFITAPNFGAYDDNLPAFLDSVKAQYCAIVASNSNPPADSTMSALLAAGLKEGNILVTRDGSIEISIDSSAITMKQ